MLQHYIRDNDGSLIEITDRVRVTVPELAENADEGGVGSCSITIEDPDGTFAVRGHRRYYAIESEATDDAYGGVVYTGYTAERTYRRGSTYKTGPAREIQVNLVDINSILSRRIEVGTDPRRNAESDIARVTWLLGTTELSLISDDTTYVASSGGVHMDAANYTGQTALEVIDDCAQQSGRNYYLFHDTDYATFRLWYEFAASEVRSSGIRISNVLSDVDGEVTFAPALSSELERDPSRVFSGIFQQYDGGYVYVQSNSTANAFARRDTPGRAENVKTRTTALARARRYLRDIDTEFDTIPTAIIVPAAQVNAAMPGERIEVKFSHLPDTEDWRWMRIRDRTVRQLTPMRARVLGLAGDVDGLYELALNLVAPEPGAGGSTATYAILYMVHGPFNGDSIYFEEPGDTPPPGFPVKITSPFFTALEDPAAPDPLRAYYGWEVNGTGTIDIYLNAPVVGVQTTETITIQWSIKKNGAIVESSSYSNTKPGLTFIAPVGEVTVTALDVEPGDIITAHVTYGGDIAFFSVRGIGDLSQRFEITGGSLV